eukprot:2072125-Amphidinium_carterae.1
MATSPSDWQRFWRCDVDLSCGGTVTRVDATCSLHPISAVFQVCVSLCSVIPVALKDREEERRWAIFFRRRCGRGVPVIPTHPNASTH